MPTYNGDRPILPQRNSNDSVHHWKGTVEKYSNWSLMNPTSPLMNAPKNRHEPGTGRHPGSVFYTRLLNGLEDSTQPMANPGEGPRQPGGHYGPLENKAAGNNRVFKDDFGHPVDTPVYEGGASYSYSNFKADRLDINEPLASAGFGHAIRSIDAEGTANSFGRFNPFDFAGRGVSPSPLADPGNETEFDLDDNTTAHKRVLEWRGVPSSKALKV